MLGPPATDADQGRQTVRILLVEDHTAVREAIAAMLAQEPDLNVVAQAGSPGRGAPDA